MKAHRTRSPGRQLGVATVEFALTLLIYAVALFGVIEFARFMMAWNTAAEATQLAARLAAVCSPGTDIRSKVRGFVQASGQVTLTGTNWLSLTYYPSGCTPDSCITVESELVGVEAQLLIPAMSLSIPLPSYRVRQIRESMDSASNPACN